MHRAGTARPGTCRGPRAAPRPARSAARSAAPKCRPSPRADRERNDVTRRRAAPRPTPRRLGRARPRGRRRSPRRRGPDRRRRARPLHGPLPGRGLGCAGSCRGPGATKTHSRSGGRVERGRGPARARPRPRPPGRGRPPARRRTRRGRAPARHRRSPGPDPASLDRAPRPPPSPGVGARRARDQAPDAGIGALRLGARNSRCIPTSMDRSRTSARLPGSCGSRASTRPSSRS